MGVVGALGARDDCQTVKILHVETGRHFLGGPQQVIYLINALRALGHDNTLVCPPDSGIEGVARLAGIRVQNLSCAGDLDLPFAYRLSQLLKEEMPDIVHCHSRRGADLLGGLAAVHARIPAVVSRRVDNTENQLMAALRYRAFRKIIAISQAIAEVLRQQGVDAERIAVIRSAVDADAFKCTADHETLRHEFSLEQNAITIAAAGQLIPRKGHRYLIQAVANLRHKHPRLRLLIFGDGYLRSQLQAQTRLLGLQEAVQFAGFREDLDRFIGCFDLFAHPALNEGLGVAALKAAAAAVPVVGFDAGGLNEAVIHAHTGLLVAPRDVRALERAIESLLNDVQMRTTMGNAGRQRMQSEFSIVTMADKHTELYESILSG